MAGKMVLAGLMALMLWVFPFGAMADSGAVHEVQIEKFSFIPAEITIKVGDTVRWINAEKRQYHGIWFKELGEKAGPDFFPGEHFDRAFDKPGTFKYRCGPHEEMNGVIQVVE